MITQRMPRVRTVAAPDGRLPSGSRVGRRAHAGRDPRSTYAHEVPGESKNPRSAGGFVVGDTGIEPVTSSVSGKRATAAPIAQVENHLSLEVDTGFEPVYTALQAAASPLGQSTVSGFTTKRTGIGLSPDPDQSG